MMSESAIIAILLMNKHSFSAPLIAWYEAAFRPLPWRETADPYHIWLSEIILQQTRVDQGMAYYYKFIENFPTVAHLAAATEDQVLLCWQGLGYYSRARNLHASARIVVQVFKGKFPETYEGLLSLKGVGPYTAAAISSISFNLPHAVVDGNVYRVLSRLAGIFTPIDSPAGAKEFRALANSLIDDRRPGLFNQAMMELGAMICKPQNPACDSCPVASGCYARLNNRIGELPVKEKKTLVRNRWFYYIVLTDPSGKTLVMQRKAGDIWQGLFEFPLVETNGEEWTDNEIPVELFDELLKKPGFELTGISSPVRHILSHQHLHARFLRFSAPALPSALYPESIEIHLDNLGSLAFPRLITRYLEKEN